jgi:hypothetical protein
MTRNPLVKNVIFWPFIVMVACLLCLASVRTYAVEPDIQYDEATAQKLADLLNLLGQMEERNRTKILIPHGPFIVGASKDMNARLLYEIVRKAGPDVRLLDDEIRQAIEIDREIERVLRAAPGR